MSSKAGLTAPKIAAFTCPPDKTVALIWDTTVKQLGVRCKRNGKPAFVFQSEIDGKAVRIVIGSPSVWSIHDARERARELQRQIDEGQDPRELARERKAAQEAKRQQEQVQAVTVGEVWAAYLEQRKPFWGELHYRDHVLKAQPGGVASQGRGMRGSKTRPGPLAALMPLALAALTPARVEAWAAAEAKTRPASARLALRLLSVFLNWCKAHPDYGAALAGNAAQSRKAREVLGKPQTKDDVLLREQLPAWFAAVRALDNIVIAHYLQALLLLGARPGEVLAMRWEDVGWQWRSIELRDKTNESRQVPLTPYVQALLLALPRRNEWVFSSPTAADGRICRPNDAHNRACAVAGLQGLTLHGLRRSFATLSEWLEVPAGVVAQIMGHAPSAVAERHYKRRPLDMLRVHHERIEQAILEWAGLPQPAHDDAAQRLRVVASA